MATTKTITVTNQTVSVPEFTERPDARVYSDAEGKCVDGINANTQAITNLEKCNLETAGKTAYSGDVYSAGAGIYRCSQSATNIPTVANGFLIVTNRSDQIRTLEFITDGGVHYVNTKNETYGWLGWQELALNSNLAHKVFTTNVTGNYTITYTYETACLFIITRQGYGRDGFICDNWSGKYQIFGDNTFSSSITISNKTITFTNPISSAVSVIAIS